MLVTLRSSMSSETNVRSFVPPCLDISAATNTPGPLSDTRLCVPFGAGAFKPCVRSGLQTPPEHRLVLMTERVAGADFVDRFFAMLDLLGVRCGTWEDNAGRDPTERGQQTDGLPPGIVAIERKGRREETRIDLRSHR